MELYVYSDLLELTRFVPPAGERQNQWDWASGLKVAGGATRLVVLPLCKKSFQSRSEGERTQKECKS